MADYSRYTTGTHDEDKCTSCSHNIGGTVMDCEYACTGVEEIADDGLIVVSCSDYRPRPNYKRIRSAELCVTEHL